MRNELLGVRVPSVPVIVHLVLQTAKEPFTGRVVRRTALLWHRPGRLRSAHPVDPAGAAIVRASVQLHDRPFDRSETADSVLQHRIDHAASGLVPIVQLTTMPPKQSIDPVSLKGATRAGITPFSAISISSLISFSFQPCDIQLTGPFEIFSGVYADRYILRV